MSISDTFPHDERWSFLMISRFRFAASFVLVVGLATVVGADSKATDPAVPPGDAQAPIVDVPGLPRVLIIGDSVSLGYTLDVRAMLDGKANVHRPPANCGSTAMGVANLDAWLADGRWDVVHFNWGLWDINRRINGKRNLDGPIAASEEEYAARLEELVIRLKKTGATLIWASTTYI